MGGAGISIRLWRLHYLDEEKSFKSDEDSSCYIFPEQTLDSFLQIKHLIQTLSRTEEIFPDALLNSLFETSIKGEPILKFEIEEDKQQEVKKEAITETVDMVPIVTPLPHTAVHKTEAELNVKLEPEYIACSENSEGDDDDRKNIDSNTLVKKRKRKLMTAEMKAKRRRNCLNCDQEFVWSKTFFAHLAECNPEQLQVETERAESLDINAKEKGPKSKRNVKGPFHCEKCPQVFKQRSGFLNHVRAHDLSTTAKAAEAADKEKDVETKVEQPSDLKVKDLRDGVLMRCEKCDLAYSTFQLYKNHMDQFHKKSLSCSDCGHKFTLENTLTRHRLDYHTLYPKPCDICKQICLTARELFEHLQSHTENYLGKTSPCEICGKLLKNKYSLKAHVEAVHDKKKGTGEFTCDECGKILKSKASLEYHRRSAHTQEYPFRCDICGKGFIKYNRMINCINNHQGIYKYRCPDCEYKTNKLVQFKEHVNSHTGEKSYFCPVCHHQSNGTKNLGCHTKQVHKLTLCQAEIAYKTNRFGLPMTEDQIEDLKSRMTSLVSYDEKVIKDITSRKGSTSSIKCEAEEGRREEDRAPDRRHPALEKDWLLEREGRREAEEGTLDLRQQSLERSAALYHQGYIQNLPFN